MTEEDPPGERPEPEEEGAASAPPAAAAAPATTASTSASAAADAPTVTFGATVTLGGSAGAAPDGGTGAAATPVVVVQGTTDAEDDSAPADEVAAAGSPGGEGTSPPPTAAQPSPTRSDHGKQPEPSTPENISTQRVFKKSSSNNKLTIYLGSRDIIIANRCSERVRGVVVVDPDYLQERKVFGQITLTFRYGREDEEVMGLKFCNEAIMCLAQLYPEHERAQAMRNTPLQDALLRRLGPNAHPFCMEMTPLAPPSVQLVPAKEYTGAPIGTSYDVRAYVAERPEEKVNRRSMVRMGIRVLHMAPGVPAPGEPNPGEPAPGPPAPGPPPPAPAAVCVPAPALRPPHAVIDKPFLLSDGKVSLEAWLNKAVYNHGETVMVNVTVHNNSSRSVRRIKVFVVQHVDVCMFSNGKFKNVVALINSREHCPLGPGATLNRVFSLSPEKGTTKNWIALEDSFARGGAPLASTVTCASNSPDDRNVFAIYVSYYVKVKLMVGAMGGELSVKLPFTLMHSSYDSDLPYLSSVTADDKVLNNGGADGDGEDDFGSRRASVAVRQQAEPAEQSDDGHGLTPSRGGKARMAQQLRDADMILSCADDGAAAPGRDTRDVT